MNKKLHFFLFLLSILLIFCLLKNIEPFGNQVLLQPGLSFDSRDTTIISLQDDPEIDNSDEIVSNENNKDIKSSRLPSHIEERKQPSYLSFEDTSSNMGYLNTDFNSPEEIELLNNHLDNLQSKLDEM